MDFNIDNSEKFQAGAASNLTLEEMLFDLASNEGLGITVEKGYRIGAPNYEQQFKMDFKVNFNNEDGDIWLLKSTSSIRSDRIYGVEFFAHNIKLYDRSVSKIFVVIPHTSSKKEFDNKESYKKKIFSDTYISYIDNIYTISELRNEIIHHATTHLTKGVSANILGTDAEKYVTTVLQDAKNLTLWNDYDSNFKTVKSSSFDEFCTLLSAIGLTRNEDKLISVSATRDIPKLSNGGYPKTDVAFSIQTVKQHFEKTISIKKTEQKTITVHEGDVADVITALGIRRDSELGMALMAFQEVGSEKALKELNYHYYDVLVKQLPSYNEKLTELFLFGVNSPLVNNTVQIADLILLINNFDVFERKLYVPLYVQSHQSSGQFGTPFRWTYPSKKRGQKIQIKGFTGYKKDDT
ncbi:MspI family type II restriction endonuclease [Veillonella caviae]|uniref:MspI family type II restriction endonuclease n=1 Tax=Veillonella caviae TaxID=248316 RepID=UPI002A90AD2B|nr:MspI family type II restriction endonuclease [Veillonella caviae]MDY5409436.1 MspI family type II restriction endonuclease [Veillonella caviae]